MAGLRVLIVEGDSLVARQWVHMLRPRGHSARTIDTFPQAQELLKQGIRFDVALVDRDLPGGDDGRRLLPLLDAVDPRPVVLLICPELISSGCVDVQGRPMVAVPRGAARTLETGEARIRLIERMGSRRARHAVVRLLARRHDLNGTETRVIEYAVDGFTPTEFADEFDLGAEQLLAQWTRILRRTGHSTRVGLLEEFVADLLASPSSQMKSVEAELGTDTDVEVITDTPDGKPARIVAEYHPKLAVPLAEGAMHTALIVDDEPFMQQMLRRAFTEQGWFVRCCGDGRTALLALEQDHYDIALIDKNMPEMTGLELVRTLRDSGNEMPVVLITGEPTPDVAASLLPLRISAFMLKPLQRLFDVVEKAQEIVDSVRGEKPD